MFKIHQKNDYIQGAQKIFLIYYPLLILLFNALCLDVINFREM